MGSWENQAMKEFLKVILGMNLGSLSHLARGQFSEFWNGCMCALSSGRFPPPTSNLPIPPIGLGEILKERSAKIILNASRTEEGILPCEQAMALVSILAVEKPKSVLEIGTFMGATTLLLAENCPEATIHTVDLPIGFEPHQPHRNELPKDDFHLISRRVVGREFQGKPVASRIVQHFADTAQWDFAPVKSATFFFIDGSHTYEYCKNDSNKCYDLCGGRGVFLWHDCDRNHPGVVRFLMEWRSVGRDIRRIEGTPLAYWKNL